MEHGLKTYGTGLETLSPFSVNASSFRMHDMIKFARALSRGVEETGLSRDTKCREQKQIMFRRSLK